MLQFYVFHLFPSFALILLDAEIVPAQPTGGQTAHMGFLGVPSTVPALRLPALGELSCGEPPLHRYLFCLWLSDWCVSGKESSKDMLSYVGPHSCFPARPRCAGL